MQDLPQYTWCVFHVHLPPEKQFHFSGLCRTFFCICQAFLRFSLIHFTCDFNLMTLVPGAILLRCFVWSIAQMTAVFP